MKSKNGAVFLPWLFIFLMISSLLWLLNRLNREIQNAETCKERLERVFEALQQYEREYGRLPALELYPVNPEESDETLMNLLAEQPGFQPEWLVCPSAPEVLREQGITYLWNTGLNQSSLSDREFITWVLVDMQALDDGLPGPHFGKVHILYSDGRVEESSAPPPNLPLRF